MRSGQQELLVLGLAAAAGSLDSWSYFGLAHVFVANMTGNTVFLGYASVVGDWRKALDSGGAILFYGVGAFLGTWLARPIRRAVSEAPPGAVLWPRRVTYILSAELALLLIAAVLASTLGIHQGDAPAHALVVLAGLGVGLQSAAVYPLRLPGVATTFVTGTWLTVDSSLAQLADNEEGAAARKARKHQLALQAWVLVTYAGGAALGGLWLRSLGSVSLGWLPVALLSLVLLGALLWSPAHK